MDQAGGDYVLAGRVLHAGSIIMTHAVRGLRGRGVAASALPYAFIYRSARKEIPANFALTAF